MTKQIPFRIYFVLLVFFFSLQNEFGPCEQKDQSILSYVRTGEYENFTRIVFEFQNAVQFKNPKIKVKGKFPIPFLDSSTNLPPKTMYETDSSLKIQSVEFNKHYSNLTKNITLTFPHFLFKTFSVLRPCFVSVDKHKLFDLSKNNVQSGSLNDGASYQIFKKPETKEVEKTKLNIVQDRIFPGRYTVYLHYSREENKKLMEELVIFLKNKRFKVAGIEEVEYKNRDIRYFHGEDKSGALLLKKQLTTFIKIYFKNTNIKIVNLSHKYPNAKKGALELWLVF